MSISCIYRPQTEVIAFIEIPALFATLASGIFILGSIRLWVLGGSGYIYLPKQYNSFLLLGQGNLAGFPTPILLFGLIALLVHIILSKSSYGIQIYAIGDNIDTARLTGVPIRPFIVFQYILCAVIGYIAGLINAASVASVDLRLINSTLIFDVILVVVIGGISLVGGRGSVWSVIVGTILIGSMLNGMTLMNIPNDIQNVFKGIILLGAIVLDTRLHPREEETARQGDI